MTIRFVRVDLKRQVDESYDVIVGEDLFPMIASDLIGNRDKVALITDSNVWPLHGKKLLEVLVDSGLQADKFVLEAGEENKTRQNWEAVIDEMIDKRYGRDTTIVALGGGMVGDMAGWIGGGLNRGGPVIQVPTTLLAQADSAVVGQAGYNTRHGKNLIGVFKQPIRVYSDVSTLGTLSPREFRQGLAETVKHGVIADSSFFQYLEGSTSQILDRSPEHIAFLSMENARIKAEVVMKDPHEKGLRKILNYGHTPGHAIEKASGFNLMHGEAVSIGMMIEGRLSWYLGEGFSQESLIRQEKLLERFGLPTKVPNNITDDQILGFAEVDKKNVGGKTRYALPFVIGIMYSFNGQYTTPVDEKIVRQVLTESR